MNIITASRMSLQGRRVGRLFSWIRRIGLGILALATVLAVLGASYEAIAATGDTVRYPPPGQLIDVGGYRLHLTCTGTSGPTVVLVTGLGGSSLLWSRVQPLVAPSTQVCVYDRAGLGWSDANDREGSPAAIASELHTLLQQAEIPGPYVLVGASIGGKYVRLFADQYPNDVAGLVLVDARHESIDAALTREQQAEGLASAQRDAQLYWLLGRLGIMRLFGGQMAASTSPGAAELSLHTRTLLMVQAAYPRSIEAMLNEYAAQSTNDKQLSASRPLGNLPLMILAADSSFRQAPGWDRAQETQRQLSNNSRLVVVVESSHHISLDQPQAVADAIRHVVTAVQTKQPLAQDTPTSR